MKLIRVGVDLAKNVFQLHGVDRSERVEHIIGHVCSSAWVTR